MLVLTRRELESILIGKDIKVTILKTDYGRVQLGVEAPRDVLVLREELIPRPHNADAAVL